MSKNRRITIESNCAFELLSKLEQLERQLVPFLDDDREIRQMLLETRWLKTSLQNNALLLPSWELSLIKAVRKTFLCTYPSIAPTLMEAVSMIQEFNKQDIAI